MITEAGHTWATAQKLSLWELVTTYESKILARWEIPSIQISQAQNLLLVVSHLMSKDRPKLIKPTDVHPFLDADQESSVKPDDMSLLQVGFTGVGMDVQKMREMDGV